MPAMDKQPLVSFRCAQGFEISLLPLRSSACWNEVYKHIPTQHNRLLEEPRVSSLARCSATFKNGEIQYYIVTVFTRSIVWVRLQSKSFGQSRLTRLEQVTVIRAKIPEERLPTPPGWELATPKQSKLPAVPSRYFALVVSLKMAPCAFPLPSFSLLYSTPWSHWQPVLPHSQPPLGGAVYWGVDLLTPEPEGRDKWVPCLSTHETVQSYLQPQF
ncbi:hypothetical protein V8E55_007511 [Tylopilus felleus]